MRFTMRRTLALATGLALAAPVHALAAPRPAAPVPQAQPHTVFVLARPVPLADVAAALRPVGARPVGFEHDGPMRGGYYSERLELAAAVEFYRAGYRRHADGDPQVFAMRLAGRVPTGSLGTLAGLVVRRAEVAAGDTVAVTGASAGATVATNPEPAAASIPDKKPWAPERGLNELYNDSGVCFPGIISCAEARALDLYLSFDRANPGAAFADDWAYEHDLKLLNENNWNFSACPPNQRNDFWADRFSGIVYNTDMPDPYLDTAASDKCTQHDLTVGSYNPDKFRTREYYVYLTVAPGDHDSSAYIHNAEVKDKDCEFSPWCVGIGGYSDHQLLVGSSKGVAPGCRFWASGQESTPC